MPPLFPRPFPFGPRTRFSPIGVELSAGFIRAVQLRRVAQGWALHDRVDLPRADPGQPFTASDARRLAATLGRRRFAPRPLVLSLPHRDTISGLLEVTHDKTSDPLRAAAQDVERTHQLPPGGYELAAWLPPVTGQRRQTAVCVTGCTHAASQNLLKHFDAAGLHVNALDSRAFALSRVIDIEAGPTRCLTAVIDTEHDSAQLILLLAGSVIYQRPLIDAGFRDALRPLVDRGLAPDTAAYGLRELGLTDRDSTYGLKICTALTAYAAALVREAHPALDYASRLFTDLPIQRFALVGDSGDIPLLGYEVCQQLRLDAAVIQPPALTHHAPDATLAVALGLTLHPEEAAWAAA